MGKVIIGYKAFDQNFTCKDFQYEVGKTYKLKGKIEICKNGFHFCKNLIDCFGYYPTNSRIAEVIALGEVITEDDKSCTDKIHILRELSREEILQKVNVGIRNTNIANEGNYNSGFQNCGNCNSGNMNSGSYNSGNENIGSYNSGSENKGNYNSGQGNVGNWNSGSENKGNNNTGEDNIGDYNSGDSNTGRWNCGENNHGGQ